MAHANPQLIQALRQTAARIDDPETRYQWTHQGACNCGHLAQTVTQLSRAEIHELALQRAGDWSEHAIDHCPGSGYPIDHIIEALTELGLSTADLVHLERLNDRAILKAIAPEHLPLQKNKREDVVRYLITWAQQLEDQLDPNATSKRAEIETRVTATLDGKRFEVYNTRVDGRRQPRTAPEGSP